MEILGIDIGGSGIKGCPVDLNKGVFAKERLRIPTPKPATPEAVVDTIYEIIDAFGWKGPVGCGFPGVMHRNTIFTAANLDDSLIGLDLGQAITEKTRAPAAVINDADAAGLAEMRFGGGKGFHGVALMVTVGTGLGTAMFVDGQLVPNLELGHLILKHKKKYLDAEAMAADSARKALDLSWESWAKNFSKYLKLVHSLLRPEMFLIGGGIAKKGDKFLHLLKSPTELRTATLQNAAGIIGAALAVEKYVESPQRQVKGEKVAPKRNTGRKKAAKKVRRT